MEHYFEKLETKITELKEENHWLNVHNEKLDNKVNYYRGLAAKYHTQICTFQSAIFIAGVIGAIALLITNAVDKL